jgi:hypothetical protein
MVKKKPLRATVPQLQSNYKNIYKYPPSKNIYKYLPSKKAINILPPKEIICK